jgi:Alginate export
MCAVLNLSPGSRKRIARVFPLLALLASTSAWGQGTQTNAAGCPDAPKSLPPTTYDEPVEYLSNSNCRTSPLDKIQFIPLSHENENYYVSFGFWIRERGEYFSNPNFSSKPSGNTYLMQRYFLHTDVHLGERFRFFGELASSLVDGRNGGPRPSLDEEKMYVHQGFFDLGLWKSSHDSLTLRAGRQEIAFGSQNLISTRDGRNIRRSVDGARLTWVKGDWTVDLLAVRPTLENSDYFDNPPNHGQSFWTAYAVHPLRFLPHGNIDLYYMGLDNKSVTFAGKGTGREQRETIGTRLWGTTKHWDYNNEFTFQWGWFRSGDIRAWAVSTEHGYRLEQAPLKPRFGLRAIASSGDQNPSSRNVGTFNSIYEKGPYFSYAELFARRNLVALQPLADLQLMKTVSLTFNPAFFWRESTSDGLYSVGNAVIVPGSKSNARFIASQASAQLQWRMNRNLTWFTEYGHFFAGDFLKQSTPGKSINYWTGWVDIRF